MRYKKVGGIRFLGIGRLRFSFCVARRRPCIRPDAWLDIVHPADMLLLLPEPDEFEEFVIKPELAADLEARLKSVPRGWTEIEA